MSIYGLGPVTPATATIAAEVLDYLDRRGTPLPPHPDTGVPVVWGKGGSSEHATGRALDFMVTADPDLGDVIAAYLWQHRDRIGLVHVIWRRRIRSTRVEAGRWRHMADRGSPTENHEDHPHAYFDGRPVTPRTTTTTTTTSTVKDVMSMDEKTLRRIIREESRAAINEWGWEDFGIPGRKDSDGKPLRFTVREALVRIYAAVSR